MNLEDVEQKVFDFLQQSSNPLVPLNTLLRYLWQDEQFGMLSESELLAFLKKHELFQVFDFGSEEGEGGDDLKVAGIPTGPRVALKSRVPTKPELGKMMHEQMDTMVNALEKALEEARRDADWDAQSQIAEMLNRAEKLRQQLDKILK